MCGQSDSMKLVRDAAACLSAICRKDDLLMIEQMATAWQSTLGDEIPPEMKTLLGPLNGVRGVGEMT